MEWNTPVWQNTQAEKGAIKMGWESSRPPAPLTLPGATVQVFNGCSPNTGLSKAVCIQILAPSETQDGGSLGLWDLHAATSLAPQILAFGMCDVPPSHLPQCQNNDKKKQRKNHAWKILLFKVGKEENIAGI